jgi:hypothetical protein
MAGRRHPTAPGAAAVSPADLLAECEKCGLRVEVDAEPAPEVGRLKEWKYATGCVVTEETWFRWGVSREGAASPRWWRWKGESGWNLITGSGPGEAETMESCEKPKLAALVRDNPATPEGKYLVKRRDGTVVEWPSFVLGARDPHAAAALRAYADSIAQDPDVHPDFPARLRRLADEFDEYRRTHGQGDPTRGIHRQDDPATVAEMRRGRSA